MSGRTGDEKKTIKMASGKTGDGRKVSMILESRTEDESTGRMEGGKQIAICENRP